LALLHRRDQAHARAVATWEALSQADRPLRTTNLVVAETQALVGRRLGMAAAGTFLDRVLRPGTALIAWVDEETFRSAIEAWLRPDAESPLSVTDAVSFEVMRREGIDEAFAFDVNFARAGFQVVSPRNRGRRG
jgi:hypothetical protein